MEVKRPAAVFARDSDFLMPSTPIVVLEIDDNTPRELPPFTMDVSAWSFQHDFNLATRTARADFPEDPLSPGGLEVRGYPDSVAPSTWELFDGLVEAEEVTWLTGAELAAARSFLPTGESAVERTLSMLFETVEVAGRHFGPDRVSAGIRVHLIWIGNEISKRVEMAYLQRPDANARLSAR